MGTTRNSNSVRIEGAIANNTWLPHVNAYVPGLEAIEAVSVVTGSFDADLGLSGGSAVNVQMKSGTNNLHGSAFEYHSDNAIKARPYFLPANQGKPKAINNQFGGTFGGPIRKDKLFYFVSYEGSYDRQTGSQILDHPDGRNTCRRYVRLRQSDLRSVHRRRRWQRAHALRRQTCAAHRHGPDCPENPPGPPAAESLRARRTTSLPAARSALTRHKLDTKGNWNATNKLTFTGRLGWLRYSFANPPSFGALVGPGVSSAYGKLGPGYGDTYSITGSGTYVARPNLVIDAYVSGTLINTNAEPPAPRREPRPRLPRPSRHQWSLPRVRRLAAVQHHQLRRHGEPGQRRRRRPGRRAQPPAPVHRQRFAGQRLARHPLRRRYRPVRASIASRPAPAPEPSPSTAALRRCAAEPSPNQFNSFATFLLGLTTTVQKSFIPFDDNRNTTRNCSYSFYLKDQWQISRAR